MKVLFVVLLLCLGGSAHAQTTAPTVTAPSGWESAVQVGPNSYSGMTLNNYAMTASERNRNRAHDFSPTPGVVLDNGYAPGSPMNSGLLSGAVPDGGAFRVDLSPFLQSWAGVFSRGFTWAFNAGLPIFIVAFGLMFGVRYMANIILTWGEK